MNRAVRPDDVGKILIIRCLCGREDCEGIYTGRIEHYYYGDKSNGPHPVYPGEDRFVLIEPEEYVVRVNIGVNTSEVVEDDHN